jgi:DNA-binding transcriptional LysR family regulator
MDLLLHFRTFVRVAELGGFSAAARALGTSQPAVSRQVSDLEERWARGCCTAPPRASR